MIKTVINTFNVVLGTVVIALANVVVNGMIAIVTAVEFGFGFTIIVIVDALFGKPAAATAVTVAPFYCY